MKLTSFSLALGALLCTSHALPAASDSDDDSFQDVNATAFAITYGYPLARYVATAEPLLAAVGINAWKHQRNPVRADEDDDEDERFPSALPNDHVLYSAAAIDLSTTDVVLTLPKIGGGRFYIISFYDLWSNNLANLGTLSMSSSGKYLLRVSNKPWDVGLVNADEGTTDYIGYINIPTLYGLAIPQIRVRSNNETDLEAAREAQAAIKLTPEPRSGPGFGPRLSEQLLGNGVLAELADKKAGKLRPHDARELLSVVARVDPFNRPWWPKEAAYVTRQLQDAGLEQGSYDPPSDVDYEAAIRIVDRDVQKAETQLEAYGNGWFSFPHASTGVFGDAYPLRSLAAWLDPLQLAPSEVLSVFWLGDGGQMGARNGLTLDNDDSLLVTFGAGKPPVTVSGFWTLALYDEEGGLIPNHLNRYSLGDLSNLTYADGLPVYGMSNRTEAFSILIQPLDVLPPAKWTNNWLPAPVRGDKFFIHLRFFGPKLPLNANSSYAYPTVTRQRAIVA
ncbi:DUF1254-domain-containing protein [Ophiocordyceps camponoti-floridani]|uniref:DUF1254-domain-containing protein n=1 Tax=Ophiocordyceps camponoti-floridani TaxID=2030778 RepID=A0A8H4QD19_9HYPO|nr:DUF1254-domain-containing protein [Ophiocordyceps camponoti-floridani]